MASNVERSYGRGGKINCCYQCKERTVDCHGTCEKYKAFRQEEARKLDEINKARHSFNDMVGYFHQSAIAMRKRGEFGEFKR